MCPALHITHGICMLERDIADVLPPLRLGLKYLNILDLQKVHKTPKPGNNRCPIAYMRRGMDAAMDRLTRALWPSVTYWNLGQRREADSTSSNKHPYHAARIEALKRVYMLRKIGSRRKIHS